MAGWLALAQTTWVLVRELDWRPIRMQAEAPPRIAILGTNPILPRVQNLLGNLQPLVQGTLSTALDEPLPDLTVLLPNSAEEVTEAMRVAGELEARDGGALVLAPIG